MGTPRSEEKELAAAMRTAASELALPAGLVAGGIARGRRMRRARRIRMGAAAAAVLAVAGTGVVVAATAEDAPRSRVASGAAAVPTGSPTPSVTPEPGSGISAPAGKEPVSAQELARILLQQPEFGAVQRVPTGSALSPKSGGAGIRVGAFAVVTLENGKGTTLLRVSVWASTPKTTGPDCPDTEGVAGRCVAIAEPDGTRGYAVETIPTYLGGNGKDGLGGQITRSVRVMRPDGVEVSITETTDYAGNSAVATSEKPPLPLSRLQELTLKPFWQLWVDPEVNLAARGKLIGFKDVPVTFDPDMIWTRETPTSALPPAGPPQPPTPTR
ncbi:hypothetical protein OG948_25360 [Embleya sp. NBC_00888]|uniref:hypothetical protein n=1 Tax=Embleya sp. NBC_00888 TaxID=2975960 RepID=UPI00386AD3FC|nr:hypothetical protein OG948_25360 [Embleya sp. NBC_00888]